MTVAAFYSDGDCQSGIVDKPVNNRYNKNEERALPISGLAQVNDVLFRKTVTCQSGGFCRVYALR